MKYPDFSDPDLTIGDLYRPAMGSVPRRPENAGYEVSYYGGRWGWTGPCVKVDSDELQEVMSATKVPVQYESLGLGLVVYPRARS